MQTGQNRRFRFLVAEDSEFARKSLIRALLDTEALVVPLHTNAGDMTLSVALKMNTW